MSFRFMPGLLVLVIAGMLPVANAFWPFSSRDDDKLGAQPLPAAYKREHCDPIQTKIFMLNSRHGLGWALARPQVAWLKNRHRECLVKVLDAETRYLRAIEPGGKIPGEDDTAKQPESAGVGFEINKTQAAPLADKNQED